MIATKRHVENSKSAFIVYVNPQTEKEEVLLISSNKSEFVIGREPSCDLIVSNRVISPKHCVIKQDENSDWIVFDMSSLGTYVNRVRLVSGCSLVLETQDTITLTGPHSYPIYFYISDNVPKKKLKLCDEVSPIKEFRLSTRNKGVKEENDAVIILISEEDENPVGNGCHYSRPNKNKVVFDGQIDSLYAVVNDDSNKSITSKKKLEVSNEGPDNSDECENDVESLYLNLKCLKNERFKLMEQAAYDCKQLTNKITNLNPELQVMECRNKLNNETIDDLKMKLNEMKGALRAKDNKLKVVEAKLFVSEQKELKEEDVKNEVMLKVNKDVMDMLENELQCSICNEIIIEATVLNCTHLFCYFCISTWMKNKKVCPVCRSAIKDVVKSRAVDSFIDKILHKHSHADYLVHRKQIVDERKKSAGRPARHRRQPRNRRAARGEQADAIRFNAPGVEGFPSISGLTADLNRIKDEFDSANEFINACFSIIRRNHSRINTVWQNTHLRRGRRAAVRLQPRDIFDSSDDSLDLD